MSFDLVGYAEKHRYRVRNLHDGYVCPTSRRRGKRKSIGYLGRDDRHNVIVCQDGYVDIHGPGEIGWYFTGKSARMLKQRLPGLEAAGAVVEQLGDTEAAGRAPVDSIGTILKILRVSKLKPGNSTPNTEGLRRTESMHRRRVG